MKLKSIYLITVFMLVPFITSQAATHKKGTTAANFLKLEIGARAAALGGAFVGLADDASAAFWNPAGVALPQNLQLTFQNTDLYAGMKQTFLAASYPFLPNISVGIYVNHLDIGDFEETTLYEPEGTGASFSAKDLAVGFALSSQLTNHVSVGLAGKFVEQRIWHQYTRSYAFDLGTIYRFSDSGLSVGMLLSNLGPGMSIDKGSMLTFRRDKPEEYPGSPEMEAQLKTKEFPLPMAFSLGVAAALIGDKSFFIRNDKNKLLFLASANDAVDAPFRMNFGLEYGWNQTLIFRAGHRLNYDTASLSFGFGLDLYGLTQKQIKFDYAWIDYGDLNAISMWSFSVGF